MAVASMVVSGGCGMCIIGIAVIMGGGCCCGNSGGGGGGGGPVVGAGGEMAEVVEEEVWRDFKAVISGPGAPTRSCLNILLAC